MAETSTDDAVVLERTFAAPPATVWAMWTEPDHFVSWYGPDELQWDNSRGHACRHIHGYANCHSGTGHGRQFSEWLGRPPRFLSRCGG